MPVVSDFTTIIGDVDTRVGDNAQPRTFQFDTGGRYAGSNTTSYVIFMVKGITVSDKNPSVQLNGKTVGQVMHNQGGSAHQWQTQIVYFSAADLNSGNNVIEFNGATYEGGGSDHFDDYYIRGLTCHFKQQA